MTTAHLSSTSAPARPQPEPGQRRADADRHGRDGERGSVAAQVVIAMPVLVLLVLLIVQFSLAAYAQHVAQGAADQALDAARVLGATNDDGHAEADSILTQLATGPLSHPTVTVTRNAASVTVQISGAVENIWGGPTLHVHAQASGPIEQWTTP